jgi:16S rRNA C967 or C1407 C5-methylase (RsmB/RsmF family)|eukprot:COSAG01_NODE_2939_length_6824_cov_6.394349_3_plen_56_part_00
MLPALALSEGMAASDAVLDLCAAPGSKSLQLVGNCSVIGGDDQFWAEIPPLQRMW